MLGGEGLGRFFIHLVVVVVIVNDGDGVVVFGCGLS